MRKPPQMLKEFSAKFEQLRSCGVAEIPEEALKSSTPSQVTIVFSSVVSQLLRSTLFGKFPNLSRFAILKVPSGLLREALLPSATFFMYKNGDISLKSF